MEITRVGFGAWAIGGAGWAFGWSRQDDSESVAAIRHAVERGINWIDTAAVYGLGHSEEIVARALREIPERERPYVFTKCGLVWDEQDRATQPRRVGDAGSLRREVEDSLRRLGVERIDLYQMHRPAEDGTPVEQYWQTLLDLKAEGTVRAVGLSNHNVEQLTAAERLGHVETLQPPFSAIRREAAAAELPWCAAHGTGAIVYSPMQAGLLSGTFTLERAVGLPDDDWRSRSPEFRGELLRRNLDLAAALTPIAERHGTSVGAVAVAWTLAWPGVTGAIVGARRPSQIEGWLPAASLELSAADLDEVAAALERTGAGAGPTRPAA
jgi:aryl-alcohol dehydrogenase-like predicted oxidoreductase